jgi:hypothetical protein
LGGARLYGIFARREFFAADDEVERDVRLDVPVQAGDSGD